MPEDIPTVPPTDLSPTEIREFGKDIISYLDFHYIEQRFEDKWRGIADRLVSGEWPTFITFTNSPGRWVGIPEELHPRFMETSGRNGVAFKKDNFPYLEPVRICTAGDGQPAIPVPPDWVKSGGCWTPNAEPGRLEFDKTIVQDVSTETIPVTREEPVGFVTPEPEPIDPLAAAYLDLLEQAFPENDNWPTKIEDIERVLAGNIQAREIQIQYAVDRGDDPEKIAEYQGKLEDYRFWYNVVKERIPPESIQFDYPEVADTVEVLTQDDLPPPPPPDSAPPEPESITEPSVYDEAELDALQGTYREPEDEEPEDGRYTLDEGGEILQKVTVEEEIFNREQPDTDEIDLIPTGGDDVSSGGTNPVFTGAPADPRVSDAEEDAKSAGRKLLTIGAAIGLVLFFGR